MSSGIYFSISILPIDLLNLSNLLTSSYNRDDLILLYLPTIVLISLMCTFCIFLEMYWFYVHTFSGLWNYRVIYFIVIYPCCFIFAPAWRSLFIATLLVIEKGKGFSKVWGLEPFPRCLMVPDIRRIILGWGWERGTIKRMGRMCQIWSLGQWFIVVWSYRCLSRNICKIIR